MSPLSDQDLGGLFSKINSIPSLAEARQYKVRANRMLGYTYLVASVLVVLSLPYLTCLALYLLALLSAL